MSSKYLGRQFDIHGGGMDLQFPHHECEIAQSTIALGIMPARYWMHNNMITINGKKMGKSYNNIITLSELFHGGHPVLEKGYHPMTVRFFILQTHYRSTLDFSNEALQAAEKGLDRLWSAYEVLKGLQGPDDHAAAIDEALDRQVTTLCRQCDEFMNDDFNTAKTLANLFELVPVINSIKSGQVSVTALSGETFALLQQTWHVYLEDILGLHARREQEDDKLNGVMQLLLDIRREVRKRKDYTTSDQIRDALQQVGITVKDEKDGTANWTIN
jgi:cysteinyl-tRNA synthetase